MKTIIILLFIIPFNLSAHTYYVATNGNDNNPGTETQAWASLQKAASTLMAGDTVYIKAGTYHERVIVQNSGTLNHDIVFSNYQNDVVTVDGSGISWGGSWNGLFDISDKHFINISGINVKNADYGGFWIENSDHISIENCYTYNTVSSGIGVWNSSYININNNEIELACNDGVQECITISNTSYSTISHNNVHDNGSGANGGEGIDVKQGSHDVNVFKNKVHHLNERIGIYADAWDAHTYNINIYQNIVHDCGNNGMVVQTEMGGTIEHVSFYDNIVYRNKWDGIAVGSVTASNTVTSTPVYHIKIINNTIYNNGAIQGGWGYGVLVDNPDAQDIVIRNNICSQNSAQIAIQHIASGGIVDHNLLDGNNVASGTLSGTDSVVGDPLFVDVNGYDFHLLSNSPAIDHGSSVDAPNFDFEDADRPYGNAFDMGAYEYTLASQINDATLPLSLFDVFPNPCSGKLTILKKGNKAQNYSLQLFDSSGRFIKKINDKPLNTASISFDTAILKPGLYILNISLNNQRVEKKKLIVR